MPRSVLALGAALTLVGSSPASLTRLAGNWLIHFRPVPVTRSTQGKHGVATLTLEVVSEHGHQVLMGPYSLSMGGLTRPDPCITTGGTARLVPMRKDSVRVDLRQGFNCGLWIVGVVRGDSVLGRWRQRAASGTVAQGRFAMTRAGH
jgi:hypothetical protein